MNIKKRAEEEREIKSEKTSEQNLRKILKRNDSLLHAKSNLKTHTYIQTYTCAHIHILLLTRSIACLSAPDLRSISTAPT